MKRYVKLRRSNILKKIFIVTLLTIFSFLFFLRWTGYIANTPLNWKRPNVEYIDGEENSLIQKNDQLWINLRFNKNHANIKTAYVWVDDKENKKELQPNSNTYIFKNLERTESDIKVKLKVEGEFVADTLGLYYFDINSYKKEKDEKDFNGGNILVKQEELIPEENTINLDSVIDGEGNTLSFIDHPNEKYLLFGGGITQINNKTYLVYSFPFYGYIWGIPQINQIYSSVNEKNGTVTINQIGVDENNFDNEGQEWLQFDFLYKDGIDWKIANQKLIEYQTFKKEGLNFTGILRDETYFPTPTSQSENLKYKVNVQLKYGYDLSDTPEIDDTPPKSSNVYSQEFSFRPETVIIDDVFTYKQPNYYYEYDSSGNFEEVLINWNEGEWTDLPDKTQE